MHNLVRIAVLSSLVLIAGTAGAFADACSGHSHETGTLLGAGGGALIGGLASHSVVGAVVGGVAGGFAGNAIARGSDCDRHERHRYSYRGKDGHIHYAYR